jgi:heme/copper-type cytochrome/quinol oxidase subunit 2
MMIIAKKLVITLLILGLFTYVGVSFSNMPTGNATTLVIILSVLTPIPIIIFLWLGSGKSNKDEKEVE